MGRKRNHDAQVSAKSRGDSWTGKSEEKRISDEWAGHKMHCTGKLNLCISSTERTIPLEQS